MQHSYSFLFPFEHVRKNSKIVIYGAGEVGVEYLYQIQMTNYCELVAILDRNYLEHDSFSCTVLPPEEIVNLDYDVVVIAMKTGRNIDEIVHFLNDNGVCDERIVLPPIREEPDIYGEKDIGSEYAYDKSKLSIMINYSGGIGDNIARVPFLKALIKEIPNCLIDLFLVNNADFVRYLLKDMDSINTISAKTGEKERYAVAFDGIPRTIKITWFNEELLREINPGFCNKVKSILKFNDEEKFSWSLPYYVSWKRYLFEGKDYYSSQDCQGIMEIDRNVDIPLTEKGKYLFREKELSNYISICTGNGTSKDKSLITKSWPKEYFENLIDLIKHEFPQNVIIQVDASGTEKLKNVDKYLLGEPFEVISWALKETRLLISVDGGMVHLASQLGTKCAVLFGPTSMDYLGYDSNINISSKVCEPCYGIYSNSYRCARRMDKPECMYSMTPEYVFERIKGYLTKDTKEKSADAE